MSIGYNGAPRGFPDDEVPLVHNENDPIEKRKNSYMVHAELNSILNYGGSLKDLQGATLYVTISPCHECAKTIIQTGIFGNIRRFFFIFVIFNLKAHFH